MPPAWPSRSGFPPSRPDTDGDDRGAADGGDEGDGRNPDGPGEDSTDATEAPAGRADPAGTPNADAAGAADRAADRDDGAAAAGGGCAGGLFDDSRGGLAWEDRVGVTMRTRLAAPKLLLRAELSALLDGERLPVAVLTRLVGGKLNPSSGAARRLLDARGAEVRTIIVDQGQVVGSDAPPANHPGSSTTSPWPSTTPAPARRANAPRSAPISTTPPRGGHSNPTRRTAPPMRATSARCV
jgi:hypothetical protein